MNVKLLVPSFAPCDTYEIVLWCKVWRLAALRHSGSALPTHGFRGASPALTPLYFPHLPLHVFVTECDAFCPLAVPVVGSVVRLVVCVVTDRPPRAPVGSSATGIQPYLLPSLDIFLLCSAFLPSPLRVPRARPPRWVQGTHENGVCCRLGSTTQWQAVNRNFKLAPVNPIREQIQISQHHVRCHTTSGLPPLSPQPNLFRREQQSVRKLRGEWPQKSSGRQNRQKRMVRGRGK